DKGSNFDELLETAKSYVKSLVLLGETASNIENCAKNKGFNDIHIVKDMEEAVKTSYEISKSGDIVLLSPACASWDMYESLK
ncbi:UDP-N-acetylmuramoyl-L-alanine--D-glutamate ligase, partial [Clostridioides difficile]